MQNVDDDEQMAKVPMHTSFISLHYLKLSGMDFDYISPYKLRASCHINNQFVGSLTEFLIPDISALSTASQIY